MQVPCFNMESRSALPMTHHTLIDLTPVIGSWLKRNPAQQTVRNSGFLLPLLWSRMIMATVSTQAENPHHGGGGESAWYILSQAQWQWVVAHCPPLFLQHSDYRWPPRNMIQAESELRYLSLGLLWLAAGAMEGAGQQEAAEPTRSLVY